MRNLLKGIRRRWGISAPRMTIRTHVAWYWRWTGLIIAAAITYALGTWIYDAGRRYAGFDRSEVSEEISRLRATVGRLESETAGLRAVVDASESRLKIEQTAQSRLGAQVKALEDENNRLKEDLAFFENLVPGGGDKLVINRFRVEQEGTAGEYRYRLLVVQGARQREFVGNLQLLVQIEGADGRSAMMNLPEPESATNKAASSGNGFKLAFKYFHRAEGAFKVPAGAKVVSVQVRIFESGSSQPRATQLLKLS